VFGTEQTLWTPAVDDPYLSSMNYLNQIAIEYPEAISLAAGRPDDRFFDWDEYRGMVDRFTDWYMDRHGVSRKKAMATWGQYGKTKGVICENIAEMMRVDDDVTVDPESIVVTVGAQEGMALLVNGMCDPARDVILMSDPSYVGMVGAAKVRGVEVVTIPRGETGPDLEALRVALARTRARGKRCRLYYEIPDFHNPTGTQMTVAERTALLAMAEEEDFHVVEDNPYGLFSYEADRLPTMKHLDRHRRVIYLGSFAKTLVPGLRMGWLVADQQPENGFPLADRLSRVKSMMTVNTSSLLQTMAGGILVAHGHSLRRYVADRVAVYREKRDRLLAGLDAAATPALRQRLSWTRPKGGFFLTMTTPRVFDNEAVLDAAGRFGVIVCPMSMFSLEGTPENRIRLSFSYADGADLEEGARRLIRYLETSL